MGSVNLRNSALLEQRAHNKLRAARLTFDAAVSYVDLPMRHRELGYDITVSWPFLLPHTIVLASIMLQRMCVLSLSFGGFAGLKV